MQMNVGMNISVNSLQQSERLKPTWYTKNLALKILWIMHRASYRINPTKILDSRWCRYYIRLGAFIIYKPMGNLSCSFTFPTSRRDNEPVQVRFIKWVLHKAFIQFIAVIWRLYKDAIDSPDDSVTLPTSSWVSSHNRGIRSKVVWPIFFFNLWLRFLCVNPTQSHIHLHLYYRVEGCNL